MRRDGCKSDSSSGVRQPSEIAVRVTHEVAKIPRHQGSDVAGKSWHAPGRP
jgi:hypothetical protein